MGPNQTIRAIPPPQEYYCATVHILSMDPNSNGGRDSNGYYVGYLEGMRYPPAVVVSGATPVKPEVRIYYDSGTTLFADGTRLMAYHFQITVGSPTPADDGFMLLMPTKQLPTGLSYCCEFGSVTSSGGTFSLGHAGTSTSPDLSYNTTTEVLTLSTSLNQRYLVMFDFSLNFDGQACTGSQITLGWIPDFGGFQLAEVDTFACANVLAWASSAITGTTPVLGQDIRSPTGVLTRLQGSMAYICSSGASTLTFSQGNTGSDNVLVGAGQSSFYALNVIGIGQS